MEEKIMETAVKPRICVIGAGAIGGLFGARLAHGGQAQVSVVARGRTLDALRASGWVLEMAGERIAPAVQAVSPAEAASLGPQDIVILAVKAYALEQVVALVAPLLGPDTLVVPAVNGVPWWFTGRLDCLDPRGVIAGAIPIGRVVGAVVYPSCSSPAPGVSRHGSGSRLVFGEIAGGAPTPRIEALVRCLRAAGLDAEATTDIRTEVWKKLLGNACFNPVSMLTGSATDRLIDDAGIHRLFVSMMQETIAVGRALGIDPGIEPAARIAITRKLGHVKTSMLQDAEAGRPVEVEAILGAVIELARRHGVDTPHNQTVLALARMRAATAALA